MSRAQGRHDSPAKHRGTDPTCTDAGLQCRGRRQRIRILNHYFEFSRGISLDKDMTVKLRGAAAASAAAKLLSRVQLCATP